MEIVFFFTISPNEQHSALVLKLSRFRERDPYVRFSDIQSRRMAAKDAPSLHAKRHKGGYIFPFPLDAIVSNCFQTMEKGISISLNNYNLYNIKHWSRFAKACIGNTQQNIALGPCTLQANMAPRNSRN